MNLLPWPWGKRMRPHLYPVPHLTARSYELTTCNMICLTYMKGWQLLPTNNYTSYRTIEKYRETRAKYNKITTYKQAHTLETPLEYVFLSKTSRKCTKIYRCFQKHTRNFAEMRDANIHDIIFLYVINGSGGTTEIL